jgi:hypothetical protein
MDTDALDRMNEFFDFAALEQSAGVDSTHASREQVQPYFQPDNITVIDWAVEPTAHDSPADTLQLYDLPMYDVTQDLSNVNWKVDDFQHMKDSRMGDAVDLTFPPSLSSSLALMQCNVQGDDEGGSHDAPDAQLEPCLPHITPSIIPTGASLDLERLAARPIASQPQASSATWKPASAKRKGTQSRIPLEARQILEDEFAANPYPCTWELDIIAHQANLDVKKVRNWFNNTRARKKCAGESRLV